MIKIEFTKKIHVNVDKDGNKLGLKKKREVIKELSWLVDSGITLHINPKFTKKDKDEPVWRLYGFDKDIIPWGIIIGESSSDRFTYEEVVKRLSQLDKDFNMISYVITRA